MNLLKGQTGLIVSMQEVLDNLKPMESVLSVLFARGSREFIEVVIQNPDDTALGSVLYTLEHWVDEHLEELPIGRLIELSAQLEFVTAMTQSHCYDQLLELIYPQDFEIIEARFMGSSPNLFITLELHNDTDWHPPSVSDRLSGFDLARL